MAKITRNIRLYDEKTLFGVFSDCGIPGLF